MSATRLYNIGSVSIFDDIGFVPISSFHLASLKFPKQPNNDFDTQSLCLSCTTLGSAHPSCEGRTCLDRITLRLTKSVHRHAVGIGPMILDLRLLSSHSGLEAIYIGLLHGPPVGRERIALNNDRSFFL